MPRVARECALCRAALSRGAPVMQTKFMKLTQHLRQCHGVGPAQARVMASRQRSRATGKSTTGKVYFMCCLPNCGLHVCNKNQHLKTVHGLEPGTWDFQAAVRLEFRRVRERYCARPATAADLASLVSGSDSSMSVPSDVSAPVIVDGSVQAEMQSATSGSDVDDNDMEYVTPSNESTTYMGPGDISYEKHQRLIPKGFRAFEVVLEWHAFRCERAGGNKKPHQHQEDVGYVNRFLAMCNFQGDRWERVTPEKLSEHDKILAEKFEPGTVNRILQTLKDFWCWAKNQHHITRREFGPIYEYISGCLKSTRKDVSIRNTHRNVDQMQAIYKQLLFYMLISIGHDKRIIDLT